MNLLRFLHRRRQELDARVASATARAETAREEVARSQARQESVREHVVKPLRKAAEHNQFAEMIKTSLIEGRGRAS